mmetsp:Transcript_29800/g.43745  ORF Transcript_29800/g.43745 Transcript_29800/m.43745 type:complete len:91 (-) Transcript_29800:353-625(-)
MSGFFSYALLYSFLRLFNIWWLSCYLGLVDYSHIGNDYHDFDGRVFMFEEGANGYSFTYFMRLVNPSLFAIARTLTDGYLREMIRTVWQV